jgi:hypothetical protein
LEEGRLSEMGIIVIDELHMVSSALTFLVVCHEIDYMLVFPAFLYLAIIKDERETEKLRLKVLMAYSSLHLLTGW